MGRAREEGQKKGKESYGEILENDFMPAFLGPRVSNEGEMRAGPIWNNRIPFAIVFLSVSLSLSLPTGG